MGADQSDVQHLDGTDDDVSELKMFLFGTCAKNGTFTIGGTSTVPYALPTYLISQRVSRDKLAIEEFSTSPFSLSIRLAL